MESLAAGVIAYRGPIAVIPAAAVPTWRKFPGMAGRSPLRLDDVWHLHDVSVSAPDTRAAPGRDGVYSALRYDRLGDVGELYGFEEGMVDTPAR